MTLDYSNLAREIFQLVAELKEYESLDNLHKFHIKMFFTSSFTSKQQLCTIMINTYELTRLTIQKHNFLISILECHFLSPKLVNQHFVTRNNFQLSAKKQACNPKNFVTISAPFLSRRYWCLCNLYFIPQML